MSWPAPSDYQAAVQNPGSNFLDPELRACQVAKTRLGLPRVASGTFASVYELHRAQARFAVRCFTREVTNQDKRYSLISQHLAGFASPYLVDFQYLEKGIRVQGHWFPIVKMGWVEGQALQTYVEQHLDAPAILQALAKQLRALVGQLRGLNMAHGDLQHGNILVTPQAQLKLVDYDGMFVPAMRGQPAAELGHANFQHPRRTPAVFDEQLDNFSALVIFLSLGALASNKGLWSKYHNGDNLVLRRPDFEAPGSSAVFKELLTSREPAVRKLAEALRDACAKPPGVVASLESCLSGISIPVAKPSGRSSPSSASSPARTPPTVPPPAVQPSVAPVKPEAKWRVWQVVVLAVLLASALGYAYWNFYPPSRRGPQDTVAERERLNRPAQQARQPPLKTNFSDASTSEAKLAATEAELRKEREQTAATQQRLAQSESTRKALETEKQQLAQQLQTVSKQKAEILQHADKLAEGVTTLAQSSDKLADRVAFLAKNSGDLTKEVREYRPLAANSIYNDFASNRVHAQLQAFRSGTFGLDQNRRRETETILATDGGHTYSICHVEDTPLTFWNPGIDWEKLTGTLSRLGAQIPIERLSFYLLDPRIVLMPVSAEQAKQMNCKVYPIAAEPFKFPDAVLVGAREGYYGECRFQIDLTTPQYVKMDQSYFRGLFGKFNPSRGDLVFTKTGELLGLMANGSYCIVIHNFVPAATFVFGDAVLAQKTGSELSLLFRQISQLPQKLW